MKKQLLRLLSAVLILTVFATCFTLPSQAADTYKNETPREATSVFFQNLWGEIVNGFDKLLFFFASFSHEDGSAAAKAGAMSVVVKG